MIYVSQGHEQSIGLEIFIKSFLLLPRNEQKWFLLVCQRDSLVQTLETLKIPYTLGPQDLTMAQSRLSCHFFARTEERESSQSLLLCLDFLVKEKEQKGRGLLLTLPTSKDQLYLSGENKTGHTDFFRSYFNDPSLSMLFKGPDCHFLLITDHVPLGQVPLKVTQSTIVDKVTLTLKSFEKYFQAFDEVLLSGINPHAGEGGLLGQEDQEITKALIQLKKKFTHISFQGPFSGDTLIFHKKASRRQLFVYMYHDQGLSLFKGLYGLIGINITLGLPFLRMSVDHGTAFDLYGKNQANYLGCLYQLKEALKVHSRL